MSSFVWASILRYAGFLVLLWLLAACGSGGSDFAANDDDDSHPTLSEDLSGQTRGSPATMGAFEAFDFFDPPCSTDLKTCL